jgi:hypothetical protein
MDCCIEDIKTDLEDYVRVTRPHPFGEYNAVLAGFQDRAQRLCDDGIISQQMVDDFFVWSSSIWERSGLAECD